MAEKNRHKFDAKSGVCPTDIAQIDSYQKKLSLNYSRTLGASKSWIGCGYIENEPGADSDHIDVNFPFYSLVYVVHGTGRYVDEHGQEHSLTAGSVFQRRPEVIHSTLTDPDSGWKEYYLDCNAALYQHLCGISLIDSTIPVYRSQLNSHHVTQLDALMTQLQNVSEDEVLDAYISYLAIVRSLLNWHEEKPVRKDMIQESLQDFEMRYAERFDLKQYCQAKGWGYEKFRKLFRHQLGVSPQKYLIRKRMDEACRLLRSTDMRISQIADQLGYASQYEFSNQFHRYFSVAPRHYRNGV